MEYIYVLHIATTARVRTSQDTWGVHKPVQCVVSNPQQICILRPRDGLVLQERDVPTGASETKDFQNGMFLDLRSDFCYFHSS